METYEYGSYRPAVIAKKSSAGLGLFAAEDIAKDQLIIEYTGDRIDSDEANKRGGLYLFEVNENLTIDGSDKKNTARYINHACQPNAEAEHEVTEDRIYIRAAEEIKKGEEITITYGQMYIDDIIKPAGCKCATCLNPPKEK
tara:strand:+ start:278 stop:703 length:426 start_codon:yes stop_codon:yes gene_type:complete